MSEREPSEDGWEEGDRSTQIRRALLPPIRSISSALGGYEDDVAEDGSLTRVYKLGDECLSCLKDLKRFWQMDDDDEDRTVARIFAETNILVNDLLPILQVSVGTSARGNKIALACADLIGAMTWPIDVVEELREAELQDQQQQSKTDYSSLLAAHIAYKAAILRSGSMAHLFHILVPSLEKELRDRTERDSNIISLILHIIRNLAAIKDRPASSQSSSEAHELSTLQSELIVQLQTEHFFRLLVTIASGAGGSKWGAWNILTLDILHLLFRGASPEDVAGAILQGQADTEALDGLLSAEKRMQKAEKRKSVSRHSRFGTTLTLTTGTRKYALHQQSAISLSPSKVIDAIKKSRAKKGRVEDELAPPSRYRSDALVALRMFASSVVRTGLNAFFLSVLRDIRLEREKVRETDNVRVLVLAAFFLDFFLLLQKQDNTNGIHLESEEGHNFELIASLTDTTAIAYALARMRAASDETPKLYRELHAAIECFTRMLLTIDALSASPIEEHRDNGMTMQNKLYYESRHLDMVLEILSQYKDQSKRYLDAAVHLTYVLMRMLEKYSKNGNAIYVRKKRKSKARDATEADQGDDEPRMTMVEHAFHFAEYEQRLASESTINTLMIYLAGYQSFTNEEQVKRLVNLMHRIAVKAKAEGIFFKASVLNLFHQILSHRKSLPKQQPYQDMISLIDYILKRFFKLVEKRPLLMLEVFFPIRKAELKRMMKGEDLAAFSDDSDEGDAILKMPAEFEFKSLPELTETKRIGIAVGAISDLNKEHLLDWIKDHLRIVVAQREEIVYNTDGLPDSELPLDENGEESAAAIKASRVPKGPSVEAQNKFEAYEVPYPDDELVKAGTRDSHLKLLLRLLKWESTEGAGRLTWVIPAMRLPADLAADIRIIDGFLINPVDNETGQAAADLLRRKKKPRLRRGSNDSSGNHMALSDGEGDGNAKMSKRRQKRAEELKQYKSAQFIEDSDDEDLDAFYKKEAELRERNKLSAGMPTASQLPAKRMEKKSTTSRKRKRALQEDENTSMQSDVSTAVASAKKTRGTRIKPKPARKAAVSTSPSSPGSESLAKASTPPSSLAHSSPRIVDKQMPGSELMSRLSSSPDHHTSSGMEIDPAHEALPSSGRFARKADPPARRARLVIADSDD